MCAAELYQEDRGLVNIIVVWFRKFTLTFNSHRIQHQFIPDFS